MLTLHLVGTLVRFLYLKYYLRNIISSQVDRLKIYKNFKFTLHTYNSWKQKREKVEHVYESSIRAGRVGVKEVIEDTNLGSILKTHSYQISIG